MKWQLPFFEIQFQYMRSRGPGGQNVNRTNSACLLRWNLPATTGFSPELKERLLTKLASQLTEEGEILIRSDQHRDQDANRKSCVEKLVLLIENALKVQKPRKKTRPKKSAVQKRLTTKKMHGEIKTLRQKVR